MNNTEPDSGAARQSASAPVLRLICSQALAGKITGSGQVRLFYSQVSGQAKLFTTILRNCQEFWSDITGRILNNHNRGMKKSGLEC